MVVCPFDLEVCHASYHGVAAGAVAVAVAGGQAIFAIPAITAFLAFLELV